ncbi:GAF domain-containing sensor histidine kinase [Algoriphagus mannitolivorans]|uniref:GAF domain-containing sensor histidine kinase n=1 Tax=Algoriphagus mannitolivorans TaxID=226504 RepID=UPI0004786E26|nr:GAF domain-containing sensor histidine kinase [Algoriphagus mannitolivorans]
MNHPKSTLETLIPENEMDRLLALSELDLDFMDLNKNLSDLTMLAAKIAGTEISLVNLIDHYTQWSVSSFGVDITQMPREESVCQYVILDPSREDFEVPDLAQDERFKDKFYVQGNPNLRYYYGIPLKVNENVSLGALCVMDTNFKELSPEKKEMLSIIAKEVVNRFRIFKAVDGLQKKVHESQQIKNRVAHDIRGPLGGIIGLAEIIQMQGDQNKLEEVLEFISMIQKSGKSLLELADEILSQDYGDQKQKSIRKPTDSEFTLNSLKGKLISMFEPQALVKNIKLEVEVETPNAEVPFPKNKLLQVIGNLISNSLKFTPSQGQVAVRMDMEILGLDKVLLLEVEDSGIGMTQEKIQEILEKEGKSTLGTMGEVGYGFGLNLVLHLVQSLKGKMDIKSRPGEGTRFKILIPVK